MGTSTLVIRPFATGDTGSWLRCRALAFLDSNYYDDVLPAKPAYETLAVELVALEGDDFVGLMDVAVEGDLATIETVAVTPRRARRGVGTQLLCEALRELPSNVTTLDAWTREDAAANAWYVANGFRETFSYLHVYARSEREITASLTTRAGLTPVTAFFHAAIEDEAALRAEFERIYVCRRYERALH